MTTWIYVHFCPARSNTVSSSPSPSPLHRDAPDMPDTTKCEARRGRIDKCEARRGRIDASAAHERMLNRCLPRNGAVAGKESHRIDNRVDPRANRWNRARTLRKSNRRSLRICAAVHPCSIRSLPVHFLRSTTGRHTSKALLSHNERPLLAAIRHRLRG